MKKLVIAALIGLFLSTSALAESTHDGQYNFDTDAFMKATMEMQPEMANNEMAKNMMVSMLEGMKGFSITLTGAQATINLQEGKASGKLEKVSDANGSTVYKMTSDDTTDQDKILMITVTGDALTAGPENADPKQMMHFRKASAAAPAIN